MTLRDGRDVTAYGGHGVDRQLATMESGPAVFWGARSNSYVVAQREDGRYRLLSINGIGEIRWTVEDWNRDAESEAARAYFFEGGNANYILAIGAYREFLTLYPSHPKSDYAQLQVAECYFKQRNSPDRDQTPTQHALEEFQRFIDIFPNSPLVEAANARIIVCRQSLARSEFVAGYFYQRTRKAYRSAVLRYESLLKDYPDYAHMDEVLYRLGECLILVGRATEALPHLAKLLSDYPKSEFLGDAQKLMASASSKVPVVPAPVPQPSPSPAAPETRP
jgi:outer membrane protein assembly factor BamD